MEHSEKTIFITGAFIITIVILAGAFYLFQQSQPIPSGAQFTIYDDEAHNYDTSGWMGDIEGITFDPASSENPKSGTYCQKWSYDPLMGRAQGWAGIYWQEPANNWGDVKGGYNLNKFSKLKFWARGERGGEKIEFFLGGIMGKYGDSLDKTSSGTLTLTEFWREYEIDLTRANLSRVVGGFGWTANRNENPRGCTFYLDEIRFE